MIWEADPTGTLVMTIQAKRGDSSDKSRTIRYKLLGNGEEFFNLDSTSGELRTAKEIDRESIDVTGFVTVKVRAVEVHDATGQEMAFVDGVFTVFVQDSNDESPKFNQNEFFALVHENVPSETPLNGLNIVVTDRDTV